MLKMNAILGLFIFLLSVIPYCKAAENIIIKQEKLQNYSYNQINEKIIETDLVICNDDNESILTNCQKIMNMDIPKNNSFSCYDPLLEISFILFKLICSLKSSENLGSSDISGSLNDPDPTLQSDRFNGYLVELDKQGHHDTNIVRHQSISDNKNFCKIIRRYFKFLLIFIFLKYDP